MSHYVGPGVVLNLLPLVNLVLSTLRRNVPTPDLFLCIGSVRGWTERSDVCDRPQWTKGGVVVGIKGLTVVEGVGHRVVRRTGSRGRVPPRPFLPQPRDLSLGPSSMASYHPDPLLQTDPRCPPRLGRHSRVVDPSLGSSRQQS